MPINQIAYQCAIQSIRQFLVLPDDEIVDRVLLAAILCNFDPARSLSIWLAIIGPHGSGKSELLSLVDSWSKVWPLPSPLTPQWFTGPTNRYAGLSRIERSSRTILYLPDLAPVYHSSSSITPSMIDVYDGLLRYQKGHRKFLYGPKATRERLGLVTSASRHLFDNEVWEALGARLTIYTLGTGEWDDPSTIQRAVDVGGQVAKDQARRAVEAFLDHTAPLAGEISQVELERHESRRLAAAVAIVQRVLGVSGSRDPGIRLFHRVTHMVKCFAWMDGRPFVSNVDVLCGLQLVMSQAPVGVQRVLAYAIACDAPWGMDSFLEWVGGTRTGIGRHVGMLTEIGVLRKIKRKSSSGYYYELSGRARALTKAMIEVRQ